VLHHAKIHPERGARTLSSRELGGLHQAIGEILKLAIELEGSTFDAGYRTVLGLEGGFLAQNSVYGRESQPCRRCSWPITKTRIAGLIGRPTYYCPHCQTRP
jgi:formamidopyrimidine-DNA glycosylase